MSISSIQSNQIAQMYFHSDFAFEKKLTEWVEEAPDVASKAQRKEASDRISIAYKNKETKLDLSNLALTSLPSVGDALIHLESLILHSNLLEEIPISICNLCKLTFLNLENNKIKIIPTEIGDLKNLNVLLLGWNDLELLPVEIYSLTLLESLHLSNNKLQSVSEELGNLINLTTLTLEGNCLRTLPEELLYAPIQLLNLQNNPIEDLPLEFLERSSNKQHPHFFYSDINSLFFTHFNQSSLIEEIKEDPNRYPRLFQFIKRFNGLCELICNYIIRYGLLNIKDYSSIEKQITLENLNQLEITESHIADIYSFFQKLNIFSKKYPDNIFSDEEQNQLLVAKKINRNLLQQKLDVLDDQEELKLEVITKECLIKIKGHSIIIKKLQKNKYTFFDCDSGIYRNLIFSQLCDKLDEQAGNESTYDLYFTKGKDFLRKVDQVRAEKTRWFESWETQGSMSSNHAFIQP